MYTYDDLKKYKYFNNINMAYALDSLTGVLSRTNILGFAQHLIDTKTPFMMGILDIDNFKLVNDNYGHHVGDECLKDIGAGLAKYLGDDGIVGRFGGDEFVFIYFTHTDYDHVHDFIENLYEEAHVVRKRINIDDVSFFVTATIGCASFPADSDNYEDLFLKVDKALYRGKTKGRNCFIIYVESKHKNIEVHRKEESSIPNIFSRMTEITNNSKLALNTKIKNILTHIVDALRISEAVFLKTDKTAIVSGQGYKCNIDEECIQIFTELTQYNPIFMPNSLYNVIENEKIANFIKNKKILTFIVSKVIVDGKIEGFVILFEEKITRIWQEKDVAILLHLSTVIDLLYQKEKQK